ncbi:hypothetical protein KBY66_08715 [Synechococcus sp. Tobar12-5m-g]|uniref:hypothetical protein n=1 Tax=unclassified Synechococcus TaxID=2626047 RepID=UPI0020CDCCE0|nr:MULTISPECIES: hypothetical protein [unclassified Synechococcus]MCP9772707.1 hypothetical protein [Synechococcus sp. Tobar12-5m-g]MCP9873439.1 hypothetical protein [Synechococcus sp. Cruz CV-v-12]
MSEPLALTLGQKFELERMTRVIDSTGDAQSLRGLAKQLLHAWQTQRAATDWVMRQQLAMPSGFGAGAPAQAAANPHAAEGVANPFPFPPNDVL